MKAKNAFLAISDKRGTTTTPPERHCKYKEKNLTSQIIYLKKQNNPLVVTDTTWTWSPLFIFQNVAPNGTV